MKKFWRDNEIRERSKIEENIGNYKEEEKKVNGILAEETVLFVDAFEEWRKVKKGRGRKIFIP